MACVDSLESGPTNRLTAVDGQSYTWDDNGNLLNTGSSTNVFDAVNRLTQTAEGGTTLQPSYNGINDRVAQTKNGITTTFALDVAAGLPEVIYTSANNRYPSSSSGCTSTSLASPLPKTQSAKPAI